MTLSPAISHLLDCTCLSYPSTNSQDSCFEDDSCPCSLSLKQTTAYTFVEVLECRHALDRGEVIYKHYPLLPHSIAASLLDLPHILLDLSQTGFCVVAVIAWRAAGGADHTCPVHVNNLGQNGLHHALIGPRLRWLAGRLPSAG